MIFLIIYLKSTGISPLILHAYDGIVTILDMEGWRNYMIFLMTTLEGGGGTESHF